MNHSVGRMLKDNYSGQMKRRNFFRRLMSRSLLVLGGIVAGMALILLAVSVFYLYRKAPMSLLSNLKTGPNVFRTKIPQEIKIAQNLFRGKIPAVNQAVRLPAKIESVPPVAKAVPSRLTDASLEKSEPQQETELVQPVESQAKIETTPPVAEAVPFQPTDSLPEKSEPQQETEPVQPVESHAKIETLPPVAEAMPSEPILELPEQIEPLRETALPQPIASPIINETPPPVAKALPSQPTAAPLEKSESRQETIPYLPAEPQSASSQPTGAPSEQIKLPEKADRRLAEVRPQPAKEDVIDKSEKRIIHREKWLLSQESSYYTIQLMGVRRQVLLFNFVEKNQLLEQNELAFYQTTFKDKPWFQLLYGVYDSKKDAQAAADNLPSKIRKSSPWIRRLSGVQKAIRVNAQP